MNFPLSNWQQTDNSQNQIPQKSGWRIFLSFPKKNLKPFKDGIYYNTNGFVLKSNLLSLLLLTF